MASIVAAYDVNIADVGVVAVSTAYLLEIDSTVLEVRTIDSDAVAAVVAVAA